MAKDWEQLARGRLARGKGRLRSSRPSAGWSRGRLPCESADLGSTLVQSWPAALWLGRLLRAMSGWVSFSPDRLEAGEPCRRRLRKGYPGAKVHADLISSKGHCGAIVPHVGQAVMACLRHVLQATGGDSGHLAHVARHVLSPLASAEGRTRPPRPVTPAPRQGAEKPEPAGLASRLKGLLCNVNGNI
jgi:hypothetical protein